MKKRKVITAEFHTYYNITTSLDRGFTGHEHLYNFGLINMNGRVYDPFMSTFLSPDNYIQVMGAASGWIGGGISMYVGGGLGACLGGMTANAVEPLKNTV